MLKEEKRAAIIAEYAEGGTTVRKLGAKYGYSYGGVARMIRKGKKEQARSAQIKTMATASKPGEELPSDVKALQAELYKARLQISLLEAMIDISDEQYGTDIRKKAGPRQS